MAAHIERIGGADGADPLAGFIGAFETARPRPARRNPAEPALLWGCYPPVVDCDERLSPSRSGSPSAQGAVPPVWPPLWRTRLPDLRLCASGFRVPMKLGVPGSDPSEAVTAPPDAGEAAVRVLVVEDEELMAEAVATGLRREGMVVDVALDGDAAADQLALHAYDVVVLDRDLPGRHGDDLCRDLSGAAAETRVLMLTAAGGVDDRVEGLALGADDYLGKPFAFRELVARVRALARRTGGRTPPVLQRGDISLELEGRRASRAGRPLNLSRIEFALLEALLRAGGGVVSAEDLLERVWDERVDPFTNAVRVSVMRLRRKLGEPTPIVTVPGVGYRLE